MSILGTKCKGPRSQTSMLEAHNPHVPHSPPPSTPVHIHTPLIHTHVMHTHAHTCIPNQFMPMLSYTHVHSHTAHTLTLTLTRNHRDTHMHLFTHSHTLSSMTTPSPSILLLGFIHTGRWSQICPPGCYTFVLWLSQQVSLAGYRPRASW